MALKVGDEFGSFHDLKQQIKLYSATTYVNYYIRNARKIAAYVKHYPHKEKLNIPAELEYGEVDFCCVHGGKIRASKASKRLKQR